MLKQLALIVAILAVSIIETKGDTSSTIYEKPTEWRVISSSAPVIAFAVQNNLLWYATAEAVFSSSLNRKDIKQFPTLGKMPGSGIVSIAVDRNGQIWFAGSGGVAVKNGSKFINYTTENGLPDNAVKDLAISPDGKVWVATAKGAAQLTGNTWKAYTQSDGLVSDDVRKIAFDSKGGTWFGTNRGISVLTGTTWTLWDMKKGLSWNAVKALGWDKRKNAMWVAVGEKDVNCFENGAWKTYMDIQEDITSIMADTQSRIWFGSSSGGLTKFNGDEWISDAKKHGIPATSVQDMHLDSGGNMWFAMESGVLNLSNPYPF